MKQILFNTEMVKAILDGRKSVTRRVIKPPALDRMILDAAEDCIGSFEPEKGDVYPTVDDCPYHPGDILYVRETWYKDAGRYMYRANYSNVEKFYWNGKEVSIKWFPSIHMPREAARLFLRVTGVRVERLQDITEEQAYAEGIETLSRSARYNFEILWDSTIKKSDRSRYGWDVSPLVWVIEFEKISKEEALAIETR